MTPLVRSAWPAIPAVLLWTPLALTTTPVSVPDGLVFASCAGSAALALVVALTTPDDVGARRPVGARAQALRSVLGAVALGVATLLHIAAGGGAPFVGDQLFVAAATVLGALLGPLTLFEAHAAARAGSRRGDALAAAATGWTTFLALCVGWVQARYVKEVLAARDVDAVLQGALDGAWWLLEDPGWTLRHYAWVALPAACTTWARLRGWPVARQVALGLGVTGGCWWLFPAHIPAVTFGLSTVAITLPVVAWAADRVVARWAAPSAPDAVDVEPERAPSRAWRAALALCALSALGLVGRELHRARERARLETLVASRASTWWELTAAQAPDVAAVVSAGATGGVRAAHRARCAELIADTTARLRDVDAARAEAAQVSDRARQSGGRLNWLHRGTGVDDQDSVVRFGGTDLLVALQEASGRLKAALTALEAEQARLEALPPD